MAESSEQQSAKPQAANAWDAVFAVFGTAPETRTEYLWPECLPLWRHWQAVQTQWRAGMGGATGLDYAGVAAYLSEVGVEGEDRRECFGAIRACEGETLEVWAQQRKEREG